MKCNFKQMTYDEKKSLYEGIMRDVAKTLGSVLEMTAYHGSKQNFTKLSNDFFKSGYGACKYGNGIYVTVDKDTAAHYATSLDGRVKTPDGFVYTVEIPDDDGTNYIVWNRPIGKKIYDKIKDYWFDDVKKEYIGKIGPQSTGEDIFWDIENTRSRFAVFSDYGMTGVMVPDTTKEHNLINYIIFDADNVKIKGKETVKMTDGRQYVYGKPEKENK